MTRKYGIGTLAAGGVVLALLTGYVETSRSDAATPDTPPTYRPLASDLMNAIIQPRHIKLWLAGKAQNWVFADYERHNLGGAFARMAVAIPDYKGTKMTDMIDAFMKQPLADLDQAIKAKDDVAFTKAYGELTDGCNSCHQSAEHAMAVIKVPDTSPFPDQDFRPPAP